jgi:hypothetical protein
MAVSAITLPIWRFSSRTANVSPLPSTLTLARQVSASHATTLPFRPLHSNRFSPTSVTFLPIRAGPPDTSLMRARVRVYRISAHGAGIPGMFCEIVQVATLRSNPTDAPTSNRPLGPTRPYRALWHNDTLSTLPRAALSGLRRLCTLQRGPLRLSLWELLGTERRTGEPNSRLLRLDWQAGQCEHLRSTALCLWMSCRSTLHEASLGGK